MLRRLRSAGISNRAFFFRIPSLLSSGECDLKVGLRTCLGIPRCSIWSVGIHSFWGEAGMEPLLVLAAEYSGTFWAKGAWVCMGW